MWLSSQHCQVDAELLNVNCKIPEQRTGGIGWVDAELNGELGLNCGRVIHVMSQVLHGGPNARIWLVPRCRLLAYVPSPPW